MPFLWIFVGGITLVTLFGYLYNRKIDISCCIGKIKFKQFLIFYEVAPERWDLHENMVEYGINGRLYFPLFDTVRYRIWRKQLGSMKRKQMQNKEFEKMLVSIQKDIRQYQEQNGLKSWLTDTEMARKRAEINEERKKNWRQIDGNQ